VKIKLTNARLAFPALFTAKTVNGEGDPAFSASFILAPDNPAVALLKDAMDKVGAEKWGAKWPTVKKELVSKDRLALHDGDSKADYDGFAGNQFVAARSKMRPTVVDRDRTPLAESDGRPFAGCYVDAIIELWAQDNNYGRRINASLSGVQFRRDGDRFGGGGVARADEFDVIEEQEEDLA